MPNFTTRLLLPKPLTSEAYDVGIPNSAMDLIDAAPANVTVCTSSTRPSTPDNGDLIYETDSENLLARISSAWKAANGRAFICTSGTRPASGLTYGGFQIYETDTGNTYIRNAANSAWVWVSGISIPAATVLNWGGDVTLYRNAANQLKTDDTFLAQGWGENTGAVTVDSTQNTAGTATSTSFVSTLSGGTACGFVFTAPTSGKVRIFNNCQLGCTSTTHTACTVRVRTGGTIGSGTDIVPASDNHAITFYNAVAGAVGRFGVSFPVTGLTPGSTYNAQQLFRSDAGTLTASLKYLAVEPVLF